MSKLLLNTRRIIKHVGNYCNNISARLDLSEKIYNIYISNDYNKETAVDNLLSLNMYANKKIATYALDLSIALHSANIY